MSRGGLHPADAGPEAPGALPAWARVVDLACLLCVLAGSIVAASGGFRMQAGSVRVALTSPYRLFAWALIAAAVRHAIVPRWPIHRHLASRVAALRTSEDVRLGALVLLGTRPAVLLIGYLAVLAIGYVVPPPGRWFEHELLNLEMRWDTGWYVGIAVNGYQADPLHPGSAQNIVFFPAFPMLMRIGGRLLGGSDGAFLASGVVVVFGAFLGALVYLHKLARALLGPNEDEGAARAAVWLLAAYPFAVFFGALYTESLFLLAALGAFYHFRRSEFLRAASWGVLAGLTRPNGSFLVVPLAIMAVAPWLPAWLRGGRSGAPRPALTARTVAGTVSAVAAPVLGLLCYCAFVWRLSGNPLGWVQSQAAWGRQYVGVVSLAVQQFRALAERGLHGYVAANPFDFLNALGALFVLVSAGFVFRRLGLAYAAFLLVNMLPPIAMGGLLSVGRFSSVMFPSFIWLGSVVPARHRTAWVGAFMALQGFNAALFYTWRGIY